MDPEVSLKLSKNSKGKIYFIFDTKILFNYEFGYAANKTYERMQFENLLELVLMAYINTANFQ